MTETECPACRLRAKATAQAKAWMARHPNAPSTATCLEAILEVLHNRVPRAPGYLALRQLCEHIETAFADTMKRRQKR
jgi:hypothetical protein